MLAHVRFESLTGRPLRLYVLADPAPGDDGNDDRGTSPDMQLVAYDDDGGRARSRPTPAFEATTSGYRGSAERSRGRTCRTTGSLSDYDATTPGNVVQGARTALNGQRGSQDDDARDRLRRRRRRAPRTAAAGSLAARLRGRRDARSTRAGRGYRATLDAAPASVRSTRELRGVYEQSLLVLAASEDKTLPRRVDRGAEHAVDLGHADARARTSRCSGPYHLVWPRDLYHVATAQKAAGDDAAADRLLDYLWQRAEGRRLVVAEHVRQRHGEVDDRADGPGVAPDRARLVAGPHGRERTGRTSSGPPTTSSRTARRSDQERWENQGGYSPNTIATEIAGLICAAAIARANGDAGKARGVRGDGRRLAAEGRVLDRDDNGPVLADAVLPARDQGAEPGRGPNPDAGTTLRAGRQLHDRRHRSTSARSSTTRSSASCCSASRSGTTRRCSTRSRSATATSARIR